MNLRNTEEMTLPVDDLSSDESDFEEFTARVNNIIYSSDFVPDDVGSRVSLSSTTSESLSSQLSSNPFKLSRARLVDPGLPYNYDNLVVYVSGHLL